MKKTYIILAIIFMAGCSAKLFPVTQADADRGAAKFPGTDLASLNQGKMLYEQNCKKCHGLKAPASHTETQWREIVPKMARKAKVDAPTEELILKYVVTMSSASR